MIKHLPALLSAFAVAAILQCLGWILYRGQLGSMWGLRPFVGMFGAFIFVPGSLASLLVEGFGFGGVGKNITFWLVQFLFWFAIAYVMTFSFFRARR
jgi:hypothetical protein